MSQWGYVPMCQFRKMWNDFVRQLWIDKMLYYIPYE